MHNQALATDAFQHKLQMAGSEAQAFVQRARSQSENSFRCEMTAIERFESRLQQKYDCRIRDRVLTATSLATLGFLLLLLLCCLEWGIGLRRERYKHVNLTLQTHAFSLSLSLPTRFLPHPLVSRHKFLIPFLPGSESRVLPTKA